MRSRASALGLSLGVLALTALALPALSLASFAEVEAAPASLNFPATVVGSGSPDESVVFTNRGTEPVAVEGQAIDEAVPDFTITGFGCGGELQPGESSTVLVSFTPQGKGPRSATLLLEPASNDAPIAVELSGSGVRKALDLPASTSFGPVTVGGSSEQSVSVENNGGAVVSISKFAINGAAASDYTIAADNCPGSLGRR
jgi:hypothetical protein